MRNNKPVTETSKAVADVVAYANLHFKDTVEELKSLVRIPSISFAGFPEETLRQSAKAVASRLTEDGFENVQLLEIPGVPPYVYGDWLHAEGKPTLLLYAHHDVQPPGRESLWQSPPFEPTERGGRLYGRGSADDKAGIVVHTSAVRAFLKTQGSLPVNVKILIEGEEEVGSQHLESLLSQHQSMLQSDVMVLTDTGNFDTGIPTITTSLRGLVAVEFEVRALKTPVHSGSWGGPTPDPAIALSKILAALVDENGRIRVPGIYDKVRPITEVEASSIDVLQYKDSDFRTQAGLLPQSQILGGRVSVLQKMTRIPALSVNAIAAGSRAAPANIIMDAAWAKVSIRTVPDMDSAETMQALQAFIKAHAPWGVEVHILESTIGNWWLTEPKGPVFEKAHQALSKAFGRECVYLGQGGSIPFVGPFSEVLGGAPALLIGVEDPYTNAHSENESVHLEDLRKSILGAIYIYEALGQGLSA